MSRSLKKSFLLKVCPRPGLVQAVRGGARPGLVPYLSKPFGPPTSFASSVSSQHSARIGPNGVSVLPNIYIAKLVGGLTNFLFLV